MELEARVVVVAAIVVVARVVVVGMAEDENRVVVATEEVVTRLVEEETARTALDREVDEEDVEGGGRVRGVIEELALWRRKIESRNCRLCNPSFPFPFAFPVTPSSKSSTFSTTSLTRPPAFFISLSARPFPNFLSAAPARCRSASQSTTRGSGEGPVTRSASCRFARGILSASASTYEERARMGRTLRSSIVDEQGVVRREEKSKERGFDPASSVLGN